MKYETYINDLSGFIENMKAFKKKLKLKDIKVYLKWLVLRGKWQKNLKIKVLKMDIGSNNKYPANKLSNFTGFNFVIDTIECGSMEGFLQSLKFENLDSQKATALLSGIKAKRKGQKRNKHWKNGQQLWWRGMVYGRKSKEYQDLLDRAFKCLYYQNDKFREALKAAGDARFTHSIGKNKENETVLTSSEFCSRLQYLKDKPTP